MSEDTDSLHLLGPGEIYPIKKTWFILKKQFEADQKSTMDSTILREKMIFYGNEILMYYYNNTV